MTLFRALANRTFRTFFLAQCVSLIGTWTQQVAMAWLVFRLTNSITWLGAVAFASQAPTFFIAPFGGVIADKFRRRRLLLLLQSLAMCQALALTMISMTGALTPWPLCALALVLGCLSALEVPTRQAFIPQLIGARDELSTAIALNAMAVHLARFAGPLIAGWLITWRNEQLCFAFNAATYIPLLVVLVWLRVDSEPTGSSHRGAFRAGLAYAFGSPTIRAVLVSVALVSLFGMPYAALLPAFVRETLHADVRMLGVLLSASGIGAIIGALVLASRLQVKGLEHLLKVAPVVLGGNLILLSLCDAALPAIAILAMVGCATMLQMTAGNTLLQAIASEDMRGRVMGFYVMAFMGTVPFGSLLMGALAERIGIPATLLLGGVMCAFVGAWFTWQLRRTSRDEVSAAKLVEKFTAKEH